MGQRELNVLKCPYCNPALTATTTSSRYFTINQDTLPPLIAPGLKEPYKVVSSTNFR